ncbi:MAG: hypothetical protein HY710_12910, partial [Candidatus Latescibacteria bacterium]|nr:hypothetical protein [Candidatus Latescibacterota bacterium]
IEHFETAAYRLLSNLSTRPKVFDPPPAYTLIIRTEIDPAMASEYERYLAKVKSVQDPASNSPTAIRRVSVRGVAATYVTAQFFNKNAELDSWPALNDLLTKAYGEAEARSILEASLRCIRKRDGFTLMYRPDLSQPTAGSASK